MSCHFPSVLGHQLRICFESFQHGPGYRLTPGLEMRAVDQHGYFGWQAIG